MKNEEVSVFASKKKKIKSRLWQNKKQYSQWETFTWGNLASYRSPGGQTGSSCVCEGEQKERNIARSQGQLGRVHLGGTQGKERFTHSALCPVSGLTSFLSGAMLPATTRVWVILSCSSAPSSARRTCSRQQHRWSWARSWDSTTPRTWVLLSCSDLHTHSHHLN